MKTTEQFAEELRAAGYHRSYRTHFPENPFRVGEFTRTIRDEKGVHYVIQVHQNEYPHNPPDCYSFVFKAQLVDAEDRDFEVSTVTWTFTGEYANATLAQVEDFFTAAWVKLGCNYRRLYDN